MGLFDSYFDPDQFQDSGGLLGRLLSLQGQQGQYQPGVGLDPQSAGSDQAAAAPQTSVFLPVASSTSPSVPQPPLAPPMPDYGQTQNIAVGSYQMPQFGTADVSQAAPSPPDLGDRLSAGFQSWVHTPVGNPLAAIANGMTGFNAGQRTDAASISPAQTPSQTSAAPPDFGDRLSAGVRSWSHAPVGNPFAAIANGIAALSSGQRADPAGIAQQTLQPGTADSVHASQDLKARYQVLRPVLGDRNAMLAIIHPEMGKTLIAQALAGQTVPGTATDASSPRNGQSGTGDQTNSITAGQPPGLTRVGYVEIPANPNLAFGELWGIQASREKDTVSGTDFASGVREGNIARNKDGSLDVTNGTVITFSWEDNHAKLITVTGEDIAHIDPKTGRVVIQKSP